MKISKLLFTLFFTTTIFSQTKFDEMKMQYDDYRNEEQQDSALAVAKRMNKWALRIEKDNSLNYAVSFRYIGNSFLSSQVNDSAIFYYNRSLTQLEFQKRKEHPDYVISLNKLGILYSDTGDYKAAEPYFKQAIEIRKKSLGEEHPDYAISLNNLGVLYSEIGDYKTAEPYFKQALEITKKSLGEEHLDYASSLNNLGSLYSEIGDYKAAESYFNKALMIRKKSLGEEHPDYASSLNNLGLMYYYKGDYKVAEFYYKQALVIRKKSLGEEHPDYASSLNNLGLMYYDMGDYKAVEHYYKQTIEIRKKSLGEEHPDYAASLNNLGILYSEMGDYKAAETYYIQAIEIIKKSLGEYNTYYASSLNNLGVVYYKIGDYKAAEHYYKQAKENKRKSLGEEHPDYASSLFNLGSLYSEIGDYEAAEPYFKQALEIRKKSLGEEHPDYASSIENLGIHYKKLGDYKTAEPYFKHALEIRKKSLGKEHPGFASSIENLGILYKTFGDYKTAESYYKQALVIRKKSLGEEHPDYAISLNNLGVLYSEIGDYKTAEPYFKQALEITKKSFGEEHPEYASSLYNLGIFYKTFGDYKAAEYYYNNCFKISNNFINTNFEWLTDQQIELFWQQYSNFYNNIDQFSTQYVKDFPEVSGLSYNSNIITKGKLLEAKLTKDNAIANSNSEVESLYNQLAVIRKKMAKIEDSDSANQFKKLDAEANDLDAKLSRLWSDYAQQKKNLSITWNQVQENLSNDEAAIEFVRYKAEKDSLYHYNALIIKKTDVNPILVKLCTENQLKEINSKEGFSSYYPLVWAPLEAYLKNIKTIYYSPTGLLNTVPFSALYPKKGEGEVVTIDKIKREIITVSEADADFLMNKYTLHQLTSTRYLAMGLKEKALDKVESSINLVGGVNYDYLPGNKIEINKDTEYASRGANSINPLKYLEGTKTEVETINKTLKSNGWETSLLEHNEAIEENIEKLENQNSKGVLHIATHGFAFEDARGTSATIDHQSIIYNLSYNPDPMKRCGLIFAGGNWAWIGSDEFTKRNPDAEDGILTAAQVALLNLKKTKLVVLSACETGLGKIEGGEGVFGLKRAFKLAGVEQIIVSLWEVADKETMELMTLFYEDLAKTQNAIVSFEKAQKIMKDNYPTRPDLWAGFVLVR